MGFSRPEYWSRLSFPPPGNLSDPGMDPGSPTLQADSLPSEPPGKLSCQLLLVKGQHRPERTRRASASVLIKPELTVMTGRSPLVTDLAQSSFCKRLVIPLCSRECFRDPGSFFGFPLHWCLNCSLPARRWKMKELER